MRIAVIRSLLIALAVFCSLPPSQAQSDRTYANGDMASFTFPASLCTYRWTNNTAGIGINVSGTGDIAPFKVINEGTRPIKAVLTATTVPVSPKGYAYDAQGRLAILDLVTFTTEDLVPVPNALLQATSPDGSLIYVLDKVDRRTIYQVSAINNKVLGTIKSSALIPPAPDVLQISPDGKRLYFYTVPTKSISVFNTETLTEESPIQLNAAYSYKTPSLSPDGSTIYIPSDVESKVTIISTLTKSVIKILDVTRPFDILINKDGSRVVITSAAKHDTFIYKPADGSIITIPMGTGMTQSKIAANGDVYLKGAPYLKEVHVIEAATNRHSVITTGEFESIVMSPDGTALYTVQTSTGTVKYVNMVTNKVTDSVKIDASQKGYWYSFSTGQLNFDGSRFYVTNKVDMAGKKNNYVLVIDTRTRQIIDSVSTGDLGLIHSTSSGGCNNPPLTYNITINPDPPTINASGQIGPLQTTYGSPSASTYFTVSGTKTNGGIQITPPAGLEVSTDNATFSDAVTVGFTGNVAPARVYVRIKATDDVMPYSGDVVVGTEGARDIKMPLGLAVVTPAPLTVTAGNVDKTYGSVLTVINNAKTFVADGLKNGDIIDAAVLNIGTGSLATAPVKNYAGSVTLGTLTGVKFKATNYTLTPKPGDLNVRPARLTITADDIRRGYLVANPVLTFKYNGFVNDEGPAQLSTLPVASTTATINSQIGQYPITVSGASAANYQISYVAGTLTIDAIVLVVPNTFTPNGDGINDTWAIRYIEQYPKCTVMVTNRNGGQVFYSMGYANAWDGRSAGGLIPAGTYYYVVDPRNGQKPVSGSITVIR